MLRGKKKEKKEKKRVKPFNVIRSIKFFRKKTFQVLKEAFIEGKICGVKRLLSEERIKPFNIMSICLIKSFPKTVICLF